MKAHTILIALALLLFASQALAHETQTIGAPGEEYDVIVGFSTEPPFTDERNGLSLTVRRSGEGEPVENLQNSLSAQLIGPDGQATLELELRPRHGQPGSYTDDFVLTQPGVYTLRLSGFIGTAEVDLTFELHEVRPLDELRFP
ncbi:MAG TPA: hypothetical protein VF168_04925 [Trueperaceae bacterium]